jgi:hypothetical protein
MGLSILRASPGTCSLRLRPDVALESVTLETFSQEVIVGLMGVTITNQKEAAR